jgi:hypothetical protein
MLTIINELKDNNITEVSSYGVDAKQALICYIQQNINHNWNTWQYPLEMNGIYESPTKQGVFYFNDKNNNRILQSYTMRA